MKDPIKIFMLFMKKLIRTEYMICIMTQFLLQKTFILIQHIFIIEKILKPMNLLMISGKRIIISFLQISQIFCMLTSPLLSDIPFFIKVYKFTPILMNYTACLHFYKSVIQWHIKNIIRKIMLLLKMKSSTYS